MIFFSIKTSLYIVVESIFIQIWYKTCGNLSARVTIINYKMIFISTITTFLPFNEKKIKSKEFKGKVLQMHHYPFFH